MGNNKRTHTAQFKFRVALEVLGKRIHAAYRSIRRFLDEVYTRKCIHSVLGDLTPAEFEAHWLTQQQNPYYNKYRHFRVQLFGVTAGQVSYE